MVRRRWMQSNAKVCIEFLCELSDLETSLVGHNSLWYDMTLPNLSQHQLSQTVGPHSLCARYEVSHLFLAGQSLSNLLDNSKPGIKT